MLAVKILAWIGLFFSFDVVLGAIIVMGHFFWDTTAGRVITTILAIASIVGLVMGIRLLTG